MPKKGYGLRSEYAAVLTDLGLARWWDGFIEELKEVLEELSEEERDELLKSREALEKWVMERAKDLFKFLLEHYDVDKIVVLYGDDEVMFIPDYKEDKFLLISRELGQLNKAVRRLKSELEALKRGTTTRELW